MPVYKILNEKLVEVSINNEQVYSKAGGMLAYRGKIHFSRTFLAGQGVQQLAMRAVTNEGYAMMEAKGSGTICYGTDGLFVTIVPVRNDTLYLESESLLCFDPRLTAGTMFIGNQGGVQGIIRGAVSGQGLFCTTLQGNGDAVLLSDGNAIPLQVTPNEPVFVDPDAYLAHVGNLQPNIVTDVNWKTLIGQTSGESYQVKFSGQGTVYIQASER